MLLPDFARVVYEKNPLVEVICQFRFPTILRIGAAGDPARFQDVVRKEYPLYRLQEPSIEFRNLPKELSAIVDKLPLLKPAGPGAHRFSTKDSLRFISLSQDFLAITESHYTRWELFREEVKKAEEALQSAYEPAFYTRIGLRYRNIISMRDLGLSDAKWSDLLQPHILAELGSPEIMGAIEAIHTRCVIKTPEVPVGRITLVHGL
ncbi:MAG: TIGR04255 family protein, partial [Chloroflexota bacterium]|nr:TIGR04255 family protein [Chloroflexota bacterium]